MTQYLNLSSRIRNAVATVINLYQNLGVGKSFQAASGLGGSET